jgi:serine/threonine protein kinase
MAEDHPSLPSGSTLPPCSVTAEGSNLATQHPSISPPVNPGTLGRLGRYDLIRLVGQGGMGMVYAACVNPQSEVVAIKVLRIELARSPRSLAFFLKEARHGLKLHHPNILPVQEFSSEPPFIVMPFLQRGSLSTWLKSKPQLTEQIIAHLAKQIAAGIAFAHKKGLIHRDLKPSNILLDDRDQAYVADFGLALSLFNDALIDANKSSVEGTPHYMSPAMAAGEIEDTRCDIYSFGAVLYELLTGQPPYHGLNAREVLARIREGPPQSITQLNPQASPALTHIAEKAMARQLSDRYAHMDYVEADLERVVAGETFQLSTSKPVVPPIYRRKSMLVTGVMLVLLAMFSWWKRSHSVVVSPVAAGVSSSQVIVSNPPQDPLAPLQIVKTLQLAGTWNWMYAQFMDFDRKLPPEIATPRDQSLAVLNLDGEVVLEWKPETVGADLLFFQGQAELNKDGRRESVVSWRAQSNLFLSILNDNDQEIKRIIIPGSTYATATEARPGGGIFDCTIADIDHDGQLEILAQITAGQAKKPRGLVVIDPVAGREKWRFDTAPNPISISLGDLDHDGQLSVILGSYAVDNEISMPDHTDDSHCYLYCLDCTGRLRWRHEMGDKFCNCYSAAIDGSEPNQKRIVGFTKGTWEHRHDNTNGDYPQLILFSKDGEVLRRFGGKHISSPSWLVADLSANRGTEVFLTDCDGALYRFGPDLELKQRIDLLPKRFTWVKLEMWGAADFDGDGRKELVLSSSQVEFISGENPGDPKGEANVRRFHENQILLVDADLKVIGSCTLAETWARISEFKVKIADLAGAGQNSIVVFADKAYLLSYRPGHKPVNQLSGGPIEINF